jgi:hypothetical protein
VIPECAIVTAKYAINGVNVGKAGVIGPIRMDYPKVISVLDYIGKTINLLPEPVRDAGREDLIGELVTDDTDDLEDEQDEQDKQDEQDEQDE